MWQRPTDECDENGCHCFTSHSLPPPHQFSRYDWTKILWKIYLEGTQLLLHFTPFQKKIFFTDFPNFCYRVLFALSPPFHTNGDLRAHCVGYEWIKHLLQPPHSVACVCQSRWEYHCVRLCHHRGSCCVFVGLQSGGSEFIFNRIKKGEAQGLQFSDAFAFSIHNKQTNKVYLLGIHSVTTFYSHSYYNASSNTFYSVA